MEELFFDLSLTDLRRIAFYLAAKNNIKAKIKKPTISKSVKSTGKPITSKHVVNVKNEDECLYCGESFSNEGWMQ